MSGGYDDGDTWVAPTPQWTPRTPPKRFETKIVGVTFVEGYPDNVFALELAHFRAEASGEELAAVLIRAPDNPVDPNAIEVHVPSVGQVGHVPASIAVWLAPLLDQGVIYQATLHGIVVHPQHPDRPGSRLLLQRREKPPSDG